MCVWSWLSRQSRDSAAAGCSCICRSCCCCCTSRAEAESYRSSLGILGETKVRDIHPTLPYRGRVLLSPASINDRPDGQRRARAASERSSPSVILHANASQHVPFSPFHPARRSPRLSSTHPLASHRCWNETRNLQPGLGGGSRQGATVIPAEETSFHTLPYLKYLFLPRDRPLVVPLLWGCRHISSTDCEDAASSPELTVHIHIPFRSLTFVRSYRLAITPRRFLVLGLLLLHPWVLGAHSADHLGAWVLERNQSDTSRSDPLSFTPPPRLHLHSQLRRDRPPFIKVETPINARARRHRTASEVYS